MLQFHQVSKTYKKNGRQVQALVEASFEVEPGQFVTIRGPSGSGKSTILLTAGALLRPTEGKVLIEGDDPYALPPNMAARLRAQRIGFVFQQFHLVPYLTVRENIMTAAATLGQSHQQDANARVDSLIERLGLNHRANHIPAELSTGECQRTALARAMLNRPSLILADEPTGNLDPENGQIVLQELSAFAKSGGTVLVVTHEDNAEPFADQTIRITEGRIQQTVT